jgi:ketosteroid isomerase-like protein
MSQQSFELAQSAFAAFNRGDLGAVVPTLSPDVEIYSSPDLANEGTFHGHDGFSEWLDRWLEAWESFRVEPYDFKAVDGDVVVSARHYGRGKGSGVEVEMNVAYLLTVRDGMIFRFHLYPDQAAALEAATTRDSALGR